MSGAANQTITVPNPYTQMAWVPPEVSRKLTIQLYSSVGSLAVFLWDMLLSTSDDYKLLRRYQINYSTFIYWISRLATLAFLLGMAITTTAPIGNCNYIRYIAFIYPVSLPLSILLFVFRVSALYNNNKYVVAFFSLSWIAVVVTSILWPFGVQGVKIGPTNYCLEMRNEYYATITATTTFVHDTLIFFATSWAFMRYSYFDSAVENKFKVLVLGQRLPAFSRSLLHDGQPYYLCTLVVYLFFLTLLYVDNPFVFPSTFGIPAFVLINTLSCYVYRNIRFGFYRDATINTTAFNQAVEPGILQKSFIHHSMVEPDSNSSSDYNSYHKENGDQDDVVEIVVRHSKEDLTAKINV